MQVQSENEREFILKALLSEVRLDGRHLMDSRSLRVIFGDTVGSVEVIRGDTHVVSKTSAEIIPPKAEKPNEGNLKFNLDLSSLQDSQQPISLNIHKYSNEIQKLLEKIIKGSRAIDMESLCILTGKRVWSVTVETSVISSGGNLIDAIYLSVITSLLHFRKPYVSIESGAQIKVHAEKNPQPLSIHHIPIPFTFAFFSNANLIVADPLGAEEEVMEGRLTIAVNIYNDVCSIHKPGGAPVRLELVDKLIESCLLKIKEMTGSLRGMLAACKNHSLESVREKNKVVVFDFSTQSQRLAKQNNPSSMEIENQQLAVDRKEIEKMLQE